MIKENTNEHLLGKVFFIQVIESSGNIYKTTDSDFSKIYKGKIKFIKNPNFINRNTIFELNTIEKSDKIQENENIKRKSLIISNHTLITSKNITKLTSNCLDNCITQKTLKNKEGITCLNNKNSITKFFHPKLDNFSLGSIIGYLMKEMEHFQL